MSDLENELKFEIAFPQMAMIFQIKGSSWTLRNKKNVEVSASDPAVEEFFFGGRVCGDKTGQTAQVAATLKCFQV